MSRPGFVTVGRGRHLNVQSKMRKVSVTCKEDVEHSLLVALPKVVLEYISLVYCICSKSCCPKEASQVVHYKSSTCQRRLRVNMVQANQQSSHICWFSCGTDAGWYAICTKASIVCHDSRTACQASTIQHATFLPLQAQVKLCSCRACGLQPDRHLMADSAP